MVLNCAASVALRLTTRWRDHRWAEIFKYSLTSELCTEEIHSAVHDTTLTQITRALVENYQSCKPTEESTSN